VLQKFIDPNAHDVTRTAAFTMSTSTTKDKRKLDAEQNSDEEEIDVDFEWFDPAEIDFHGLKLLLRQLLDVDNDLFDLSALADLIISQPTLGSTVKVSQDADEDDDDEDMDRNPNAPKADVEMTDTKDTDPFAFLTVLNLHAHVSNPVIQTLTRYLSTKAAKIPGLASLPSLLTSGASAQVGLILTERLINMPTQIIPPMYTMLLEEIGWALEDKKPYAFTHYLILSKVYTEITSALDSAEPEPATKKSKKGKGNAGAGAGETFYFHPEDEIFQQSAVGFGNYEYTKPWDAGASDSKRAFQDAGIRPLGHMMLIEADKFEQAVNAVKEAVS